MGDAELGHLMDEDDVYCIICLDELRRLIRVECWTDADQARLRRGLASAASASAPAFAALPPLIGSFSPV
jgi:hypothetical protein